MAVRPAVFSVTEPRRWGRLARQPGLHHIFSATPYRRLRSSLFLRWFRDNRAGAVVTV